MPSEFRNEPLTDFADSENKAAFEAALARRRETCGASFPLIIGGERVELAAKFESTNPSRPAQVLGRFSKAGTEEAEAALAAAWEAFPAWAALAAAERADYLFRAAAVMRARKHDFSAQMVLEAGKSWVEADADTAETIDFLEFYGREALRYGAPQPVTPYPGEAPRLEYIPLGVGAIIPPWNFPNAILTGMASAAIVAGNTVVVKPASDTPGMGFMVAELFEEVGLPPGVLNYLSGPGSLAGNYLVEHPRTRFISFTGSMEVGLGINAKAAQPREGQKWIKRVVAEMGGKDAIIVDKDADLAAAAAAIVASAFGYQGQKCSACSRAILHREIHDRVVDLVVERAQALTVGDPADPANYLGPVINQAALEKIRGYIEVGKQEGELLCGGGLAPAADESGGFFWEPTVFAGIKPEHRLAQEEIFGPVLAVMQAEDFDHAVEIFNATIYGLTGSYYGQAYKAEAARRCHVGNFYINRKCTGALVGVHPFGGFNMSGTDSKAGGRDYLLLFLQAKSISEVVN